MMMTDIGWWGSVAEDSNASAKEYSVKLKLIIFCYSLCFEFIIN